eukprot:TRINITY_DN9231_c0_g1_i1.p1 TRINITY_DN9231_c0_g1~~TRINITY_DN9231_c0_g1_i1.p1  ORF type:complete len:787 (+),score=172.38 TRINITY_DN9231_c0_g1_i1:70-2430(+)
MSFRKPGMEKQRILILYTGGTIGMKNSEKGYVPATGYMGEKLMSMPQFHDPVAYEKKKDWINTTYMMPLSSHERYVGYDIKEYDPLLDSCNLSNDDWEKISNDIAADYDNYDAFIVLHGTDTMAYTSSALSFMLQDLEKTVIVTGSQIPISQPRNDGVGNLEGALFVAGHYVIPEVTLYFSYQLYRGARSSKADASTLTAFQSPNFPPIASVGINVDVNWHLIKSPSANKFKAVTTFDKEVAVVQLFPGLSPDSLQRQLAAPLKGAVLRTYGAGNAPDANAAFLAVLKEASDRGVIIVNTTQCWRGTVEGHYATGVALLEAGVIAGRDMTPESALVKLGWLLGQGIPTDEIRDLIPQSIRGELTPKVDMQFSLHDSGFVHTLYTVLKEQRGETRDGANIRHIRKALIPTIVCSAAEQGDNNELNNILKDGADVNSKDYDGRTGLHLAASCGQLETVELLISWQADLDIKDRWNATPLLDAIKNGHSDCCDVLRKAGATFTVPDLELATILCGYADTGDDTSLERYLQNGANPNVSDYDHRTPLHVAASSGKPNTIKVLLKYGANIACEDRWKATPLQDAITHECDDCCQVLRESGATITLSNADLATRLCKLADAGDVSSLERWFKNGANANVSDYDRRTPLHIAACEGRCEVVELLIKSGCNVNAIDRSNVTPLLDAITHGKDDVCKLLVAASAEIKTEHTSLLCSAVKQGDLDLVKRFCEFSPKSVSTDDYDLRTPLHIAASEGNEEAVKLLLKYNAASTKDRWGRTPKDDAAAHQFASIVSLF